MLNTFSLLLCCSTNFFKLPEMNYSVIPLNLNGNDRSNQAVDLTNKRSGCATIVPCRVSRSLSEWRQQPTSLPETSPSKPNKADTKTTATVVAVDTKEHKCTPCGLSTWEPEFQDLPQRMYCWNCDSRGHDILICPQLVVSS